MIKLVYCVRRRADVSPQEFRRYWLKEHGPLVRSHAAVLRARRYVQSHRLDAEANTALRASRGGGEPFDGITEVWWDSAEDFEAAASSPEGRQAGRELLEDERKFIDFSGSCLFFTEEHTIFHS